MQEFEFGLEESAGNMGSVGSVPTSDEKWQQPAITVPTSKERVSVSNYLYIPYYFSPRLHCSRITRREFWLRIVTLLSFKVSVP